MKLWGVACGLAVLALQGPAQSIVTIPASARIYVDAATGFDAFFATALKAEQVPLTITTTKQGADYELQAMAGARRIPGSTWNILWGYGEAQAVIRLVDLRTSEIVFVYELQRSKIAHDPQETAEACAKQLKYGMNPGTIPQKKRAAPKDPAVDF